MVFGLFVALGTVSTKVLTLDQMIKSMLVFLIRGTSLSRKPQYMIDDEKKRKMSAKTRLNFHIMLNSIGYFAGMTHGLMLSRHLDSVSLSLAIVMSVMMVSGLLLKYTSSRNSKIFGKLLHG